MIRGLHAMFYSSQADELRTFLRDKLGFTGTDVGDGWLIFDAPEADIGVHPTEGPTLTSGTADISFYCDDIVATVTRARRRAASSSRKASRTTATDWSRTSRCRAGSRSSCTSRNTPSKEHDR